MYDLSTRGGWAMKKSVLAAVAGCVLWGASFPLGKVALGALSPAHLVLLRFVLAAPVFAALAARGPRPARRDLPLVMATGVLCVPLTYLVQFAGLARTSVTSASLLVATAAPLLAMGGWLVADERLGTRGWTAVTLSTLGALLLVGNPGPRGGWTGDALVLLSMVISVIWVLASRRLVREYGAVAATSWILLAGTAILVPTVLAAEGPPPLALPASVWAALAGLALGSTVGAFVLWNVGLRSMESGRAAVFLNLEPLVGALLGVLLFGDVMGPGVAVGGLLVMGGAALASWDPVRSVGATVPVPYPGGAS
jgi:drug/metabolite transporter (DMT)-like permease